MVGLFRHYILRQLPQPLDYPRKSGTCDVSVGSTRAKVRTEGNTGVELATAIFENLEVFHNRKLRYSSPGLLTPIECDLGVSIGIARFGNGYASLSYLREFPVDILKIDQSSVTRVTSTDTGFSNTPAAWVTYSPL